VSGTLPWYFARSAGIIAWALLAGTTLWGLALSTKVLGKNPRPNWILDLHRGLGGLSVIFCGVHLGALALDQFVHFGLVELFVPLASAWHPVAVGWGIAAFYLLLAVELTSLLRSRIPKAVWRNTHYASFPLFVFATVHGLTSGTDTRRMIAKVVAIIVSSIVGGLTVARVFEERPQAGARTAAARDRAGPPPVKRT
jgi:hypothetical protein